MTQEEAPTLYPEPFAAPAPPGKGKHGYYRKPNGWIVVASTTPSNRSGYEYKGFIFLAKYGEFRNGTAEARATQEEVDAKGNPWNPAMEPWRKLLQLGGVSEFPVDQIIAYRWHVKPPYREIEFPQLADVEITNYPCPECERGPFASVNPRDAAEQLRTHLTSGTNRQHSYTPSDLRELAKEWDVDFDSARVGRIKEYQGKNAPEPEYTCECGYEGKSERALDGHKPHCPLREPVLAPSS